jgi:hypothetical protein
MVSWVGSVPDTCWATHVHVYACAACVVRFDRPQRQPEPEAEPEPTRPEPEPAPAPPPAPPRTERWLRIANTALSCVAVTFAAAAFCLGLGPG